MFNAEDLVLILLSMFSLVGQENRRAVWFLFEISLSFDLTTGRFRMTRQNYDALLQLMGPLSALASYRGMMRDATFKPTVLESYRMLSSILHPIIGGLSAAELREIHDSADEGFQLLLIELPKLELIVKTWARDVRRDGRLARWTDLDVADSSTDSRETAPMIGFSFSARAYTPLRRVCAKVVGCWTSKVAMDERLATAILSYWACYAAAPTRVSVRRAQRVKPRKNMASESTIFSIAPSGATIQRHNHVATRRFETTEPASGLTTSDKSRRDTSISLSSSDNESSKYTLSTWSTTVPISTTAPELGASYLVRTTLKVPASEQRPCFLRAAATAPNLRLGSESSHSASLSSSSSSLSSVAWGIGCSPAELAADGYMRDLLGNTSPPTCDSDTWSDERQPSSNFRSHVSSPNDWSSGSMVPAMPETPLKRRQRRRSSGSSASLLFSPVPLREIEYPSHTSSTYLNSGARIAQPGTPISDRPSAFMELSPTALKRPICSFDSFGGQYFIPQFPNYDELHDEGWEMVAPSVDPKRTLPSHIRNVKRKHGMHDLRAGWAFPPPDTSSGPYASETIHTTKAAVDSSFLKGAIDNVRDAWWTTSRLSNKSDSSYPLLLTPNGIPTNRATSYHTLHSHSLLAPSTDSLSPSTLATSLASTPLQTPRVSTDDLLFTEWADEWEMEQRSLWASALGDRKRQLSEDMIKPPRMNTVTKLVVDVRRMIGAVWSR